MVQHDIGLYSLIEEGLLTLGTRVTEVQLIGLYIFEVSKKFSIEFVTSVPIIGQAFLKKYELNPSISGAFKSSMICSAW